MTDEEKEDEEEQRADQEEEEEVEEEEDEEEEEEEEEEELRPGMENFRLTADWSRGRCPSCARRGQLNSHCRNCTARHVEEEEDEEDEEDEEEEEEENFRLTADWSRGRCLSCARRGQLHRHCRNCAGRHDTHAEFRGCCHECNGPGCVWELSLIHI